MLLAASIQIPSLTQGQYNTVPQWRALGPWTLTGPFAPCKKQVKRGDGHVQCEPLEAQLHECLYHAAIEFSLCALAEIRFLISFLDA